MISKDKADRESKEQQLIEKYLRKDQADKLWLENLHREHEKKMDIIRAREKADREKQQKLVDEVRVLIHEIEIEREKIKADIERIKSVEFLKGYNFGKLGVK